MKTIISSVGNICTVRFDGDFLSEVDHETFREKIHSLAEEGNIHVVIDLAGVKYINSCGLGSLVCALTTLRRVGGDLRLANLGEHVRKLLEITQLTKTFEVYPTLENAVRQFNSQKV
jgi:anti-sigma B factor antagonist